MPKNKNPAKPKTIAISDCTQNALLSVHVSFSVLASSVLASSVPAVFADNSRYANTCTTHTHTHHQNPLTHFNTHAYTYGRTGRGIRKRVRIPGRGRNRTRLGRFQGRAWHFLRFPRRKQPSRIESIWRRSHSQRKRICQHVLNHFRKDFFFIKSTLFFSIHVKTVGEVLGSNDNK
jgi:hypothetical protein